MRRVALTVFGIACLSGLAAHAGERAAEPSAVSAPRADDVVDPPAGVRYKRATRAMNDAARRTLLSAFTHVDAAKLQGLMAGTIVAGPGVWRWLKEAPGAAKLGTASPFVIPGANGDLKSAQQLEGRTYLHPKDATAFARLLAPALPAGATPILRRPTRDELAILWALVPFDLEEPLFVVELGPRHLLVILDKQMKLSWIDDFGGATMPPGAALTWR